MIIVRPGVREDIPALLDIYNYEVLNGTSTLDINPRTLAEWGVWFDAHGKENHPLLVAETETGKIAGYATLSSYRTKEAYVSTVELSVYIAPDCRRQGVATRLMEEILKFAREDESTHLVVSVITSGNQASESLHHKFGFTFAGKIPEAGVKFGEYQGIDNYYLIV